MAPGDPCFLGSITKTYTAVTVLRLAEEGRLSLDDTLDRFLPAFPEGSKITVRHLLAQTSGLKDFYLYFYLRPDRGEMIELVTKRHVHADFDDASFEYSRFRGWSLFHREHEHYYGFTKAFPSKFGKVSSMDLDTRAFRAPILHEIVDAGWRVLPCTYSLRAGI